MSAAHPITATLAHTGRWLSLLEIIQRTSDDFPGGENHAVNALHHHIRAGDIIPRLADTLDAETYEYGLTEWNAAPAPVQTELERVQAITAARIRLTTALDWSAHQAGCRSFE